MIATDCVEPAPPTRTASLTAPPTPSPPSYGNHSAPVQLGAKLDTAERLLDLENGAMPAPTPSPRVLQLRVSAAFGG